MQAEGSFDQYNETGRHHLGAFSLISRGGTLAWEPSQ